jgi:acyl carrier protein
MRTEEEIRHCLRNWVIKNSEKITYDELSDDLPIIEQRIITSLQTMDLILFIEKISGGSIEPEDLKPGVFRNIDTIYKNFFQRN